MFASSKMARKNNLQTGENACTGGTVAALRNRNKTGVSNFASRLKKFSGVA